MSDLNLKAYTAKLSEIPKVLSLILDGERKHYFLTDEIYVDEKNNKCYIEYVGGIPDDAVLQ